jgi:aminobenzoyl-glutamate utilization protein B
LTPGLLLALAVADLPGQQATMTPEKKAALDWIQAHRADSDEVAVYVWEHPELSLAEFKSSKKLQDYLRDNGFEIKTGISGIETAFIATWGSGTPVISFIGEYDALPGLSQERGVAEERPVAAGAPGHGCGHNLIGAASATAAIATARAMLLHGLKGTVRFHGRRGGVRGQGVYGA